MPLTPFHIGPALLLWVLLRNKVNLFSLMITTLAIDARAFACYFFIECNVLHGFLHNYIGAIILGLILGMVCVKIKKRYEIKFYNFNFSNKGILLGAVLGTILHVFLDSFMHADMLPLWPFDGNFLLGVISVSTIYTICIVSFLLAIFLMILKKNDIFKK